MGNRDDIAFFTRITTDHIKLILLIGELLFVGMLVLCYYQNSLLLEGFLIISILFNALTILPFPTIYRGLKAVESKTEIMDNPNKESNTGNLDMWERTCIGFYVVANLGMIVFLGTTFYNLW